MLYRDRQWFTKCISFVASSKKHRFELLPFQNIVTMLNRMDERDFNKQELEQFEPSETNLRSIKGSEIHGKSVCLVGRASRKCRTKAK